tara:strand:+ start:165 stop:482 length:318 start_codon:yes stop_codon:yes gene_type:complete
MPSCRSSGVLTASSVVFSGQCKLISIHAQYTGTTGITTVKVFDNTAASGKELARIILQAPNPADPTLYNSSTFEFDMHGVIASNGLFLEISTGAGTGAAVSVEFA